MSTTSLSEGSHQFILALADDEHLMGQRHTEWIGIAPFLEEDLAFASIGQDELGHAAMLYELLAGDVDGIALHRDPGDYRSCWFVEHACPDWSDAMVRHWLYDAAEPLRWAMFEQSRLPEMRAIGERATREETFHLRHADALLDALLANDGARAKLSTSLQMLAPLALGMFEAPPGEDVALDDGLISVPLASLVPDWKHAVDSRFGDQDWGSARAPKQAQRTIRSNAFAPMYESMREVIMIDPAARW